MKINYITRTIFYFLSALAFFFIFFYVDRLTGATLGMYFVGATAILLQIFTVEPVIQKLRLKTHILENHHEVTGFVATIFASLYGVFLAFTVVSAGQCFAEIETRIGREIKAISTLVTSSAQMPEPFYKAVETKVSAYARSIMRDEWPKMSEKQPSQKTTKAFDEIWDIYGNFKPTATTNQLIYAESLKLLAQCEDARFARIYDSWSPIGPMSWNILVIGWLYISVFLCLFGTKSRPIRLIIHSCVVSFIAMAIYLVYINQFPFKDPIQIKPKAYQRFVTQ